MVSKGQFVGLDWNRITRLHSQVMTGAQNCLPNELKVKALNSKRMRRILKKQN